MNGAATVRAELRRMLQPRFIAATFAACALVGAAAPVPAAAALPVSPAAALDLHPTPAKIAADCAATIAALRQRIDAIVATPKAQRTFDTVALALNDASSSAYDAVAADLFMGDVGPDRAQRDAAAACSVQLSNAQAQLGARPDVYAALVDAQNSGTASTAAQKRLVSNEVRDAKAAGAALDEAARSQYLALTAHLTEARRAYSRNVTETRTPLTFTAAQLAGLPADRLASYTKQGDTYIVPATEANYATIARAAKLESTRKRVFETYFNQVAAQNDPILEDAVATRAKIAHVLGYPTWAAYTLERRMAKTPAAVNAFLADLDAKLLPQARREAETLRQLKAQETGDPHARLEVWDLSYYTAQLERSKYAFDPDSVRPYYPVDKTVPAIFGVYSQLLGITFAKRDDAKTWAPNVQAFAVTDTATGRYLGDLYTDLLPREGKNAHFHNSTFWRHRTLADGTIRPLLTAIVGEFPQPAPGQPALLSQNDVETFFHEFGHAVAALVKTTPYGLDFQWDFVEAPSQMLENWVWDPAIVKRISSNVTTGAPMPDELIAKLRATRNVDRSALAWTRQIALATADMTYHTSESAPHPNETWAAVWDKTVPVPFPPEVHFEANFNHIVGSGYSAGYYGYLWSKVYAQDMFSRFAAEGLLSPGIGTAYRNLLANAGLQDEDVLVAQFVGHKLDPRPFYATLGIGTSTSQR